MDPNDASRLFGTGPDRNRRLYSASLKRSRAAVLLSKYLPSPPARRRLDFDVSGSESKPSLGVDWPATTSKFSSSSKGVPSQEATSVDLNGDFTIESDPKRQLDSSESTINKFSSPSSTAPQAARQYYVELPSFTPIKDILVLEALSDWRRVRHRYSGKKSDVTRESWVSQRLLSHEHLKPFCPDLRSTLEFSKSGLSKYAGAAMLRKKRSEEDDEEADKLLLA